MCAARGAGEAYEEDPSELLLALSRNLPTIPFKVCYWDGDA